MQEAPMQLSNSQDKYGLTVQEAVKALGICERKVRELIAQDEIPYFRVGRAVRIPWPSLKAWMDNGGTNQQLQCDFTEETEDTERYR